MTKPLPSRPVPQTNNPLHGYTLKAILIYLIEYYGWEEMGQRVPINCFRSNPTMKSSLIFLRKTEWARKKVEDEFLDLLKKNGEIG
jgi:uncharacterized protein (DUF2132 family)